MRDPSVVFSNLHILGDPVLNSNLLVMDYSANSQHFMNIQPYDLQVVIG